MRKRYQILFVVATSGELKTVKQEYKKTLTPHMRVDFYYYEFETIQQFLI